MCPCSREMLPTVLGLADVTILHWWHKGPQSLREILPEAETVFGLSVFGHPYLTILGQSVFGQSIWICVCVVEPKGRSPRTQKNGAPKGGAPKGGRPKISRYFSSSASQFVLLFPLWGSSRGILVVFLKAGALKCARLEFSGCV